MPSNSPSRPAVAMCLNGCKREAEPNSPYCAKCEEWMDEARAERAERRAAEREFNDYHPWVP